MKTSYERPNIETMSADRVLELLGPVSCGSANTAGSSELGALMPSASSGATKSLNGN